MKYESINAVTTILRTLKYYNGRMDFEQLSDTMIPIFGKDETKESIEYLISQNKIRISEGGLFIETLF